MNKTIYRSNIKPLSVNEAWQGKRYKTPKYKAYERALMFMLPKKITLPKKPYKIYLEFGMSSSLSDWDNPIKPFQDVLQSKYKFNDRDIVEAHVKKVKTKKGQEYIKWSIQSA